MTTRRTHHYGRGQLGIGARGTGRVFVTALVILLAGCAPGRQPPDAGGDAAPPSGLPTNGSSGEFPIVAYQGAELLGAEELDFTGLLDDGRPVALNLWAGLCPPCRAEMPAFQNVYERHSSEFLLIGVDIGPFIGLGSNDDARALLAELGITYPAAFALDARAVRDYNIVSMPTTVFYTADGLEHSRHSGLMTEEQFEAAVEEIVSAGS
ncbi:MAG: TlpA family protein disulfide reductase [Chloroflexota bacterium]|nr:TlpA family protein disulfide reductase [Chloroflexota bacterium]